MSWHLLIDEQALAGLLPEDYGHFAAPIREGLIVFLSGLPEERQAEILTQQAALPLDAPLSVRLGRLGLACPVLHKLGQVIARDRRLALELRDELSKLESLPPSTPLESIQQTLDEELGPLDRLGLELKPPALAEASVAVVVPFTSHDGKVDGVFKVLKPGIEERLQQELELLADVGAHLDDQCHRLGIPELEYEDAFAQVREKIAWELKLKQEQEHLRTASEFYASNSKVVIPAVLDYCTPRVTAMQRIYGCKVTDHQITDKSQTLKLANLVSQALIAQPVFNRRRESPFHSDPHAGNLMLTEDGRLAILDWSLVGVLRDTDRQAISQIMLGGLLLQAGRICTALESLAERQPTDRTLLRSVVNRALARLTPGGIPGMQWLVDLLDQAATTGRLRVAGDLMLFRKSLLTLEGVLDDMGDVGFDQDKVLLREFAWRFGAEWPLRWLSLPNSRAFSTHLSNADLTDAALGIPCSLTRRLAESGLNAAERCLSNPRWSQYIG